MSPTYVRRLFSLLLLSLCLSVVAKADSFQMTFTGSASGTGQFTTNGVCTLCSPGAGLLTWIVSIGPDSGANAFDIVDDGPATMTITYARGTNSFSSIGTFNSENNDFFILFSNGDWLLSSLNGDFGGTYTVSPVHTTPEPSSVLLLLLSSVGLAGLKARKRRALPS